MTQAKTLPEALAGILDSDLPMRVALARYEAELARLSPTMASAYEALIARLRKGEAGAGAPAVGEPMPAFLLPDQDGRLVDMRELLDQGPLVVSFNRGHWCPFCRIELDALTRASADIRRFGAGVVSIMPDIEAFTGKARERGVSLPILSDVGQGYMLSLGLVFYVGDELAGLMSERGLILPEFHGANGWFLPIPATFVVGRDGLVKSRLVDPDFRRGRMDLATIAAALGAELPSGGAD